MAVAGDDDVVVQHDAERGGGLFDVLGHGDIGFGRGRIARRVVVCTRINAEAPSSSARLTTSQV